MSSTTDQSTDTHPEPEARPEVAAFARQKHPFSRYTMAHPGMECLARAWRSARAAERIPSLADIEDSIEVCSRSGVNLHLVEVGEDFSVTEIGEAAAPFRSGAARPWGDGGARLRIKQDLITVAFTASPMCQTVRMQVEDLIRAYDQLALPLSGDGSRVSAVLVASDARVH